MNTVLVGRSVEGKFGPQILDVSGEYYSFGKFYKGNKTFDPGTSLDVELYLTEKGNKYITKVLKVELPENKVTKEMGFIPKLGNNLNKPIETHNKSMGNVDWDKIAIGKTRCLAITQLLSSVLPLVITNPQNLDEVKEKATQLADFAVQYSFKEN